MEFYNHVIYRTTEKEVAQLLKKCEGCDGCRDGFRHTCRHYYIVEGGTGQPFCSKHRKDY